MKTKMKKKENLAKSINFRVTNKEKINLAKRAKAAGVKLSVFTRWFLFKDEKL